MLAKLKYKKLNTNYAFQKARRFGFCKDQI